MLGLRKMVGLISCWVAASVIASFVAMMLALPLIRWLHLQSFVGCPFHVLTGFPCPTCGYTRVYYLLLAGDEMQAIRFQPFILLVVLLSAIAAIIAAISLVRREKLIMPAKLMQGIWGVLAASWAWNLYYGI